MAYEQKDNTGSLFKNDRREKDTHANARGSALIDGVEYWVDAWTNEAKDGSKYQSLKFKRKEQRSGYSGSYNDDPRTNSSGGSQPHDDSDVPF
jgi:hypothetical protein